VTIQEMIKALTEALKKYGDLEVMHSGCCGRTAHARTLRPDPGRNWIWVEGDEDA